MWTLYYEIIMENSISILKVKFYADVVDTIFIWTCCHLIYVTINAISHRQ